MNAIEEIGIKNALTKILPCMVEAGILAKKLQSLITDNKENSCLVKEGGRFGAVLTDADILVESIVGCFLYTTFTDVSFYGEEAEHDRISAYFPRQAAYEVSLDPINGTIFYRDGLKIFDSILSIRKNGTFVAVVDYIPHSGIFYIGIEGEGLFITTDAEVRDGKEWRKYVIPQSSERVLFGKHNAIEQEQKLTAAGFTVIDLIEDYEPRHDWSLTMNAILTGQLCGYIKKANHFIDWGALAWVVQLGGGKWNNPVFDPKTGKGDIVVATSPEFYEQIHSAVSLL